MAEKRMVLCRPEPPPGLLVWVICDMDTTEVTGDAATSAGEVTTPRRSTAQFREGPHSGKRHCGDPTEAAGEVEVHRRLSELSVVSGASDWTVYTHSKGGTARPAGKSSQYWAKYGRPQIQNKDDEQLP